MPNDLNYQHYISAESDREIQGLLPHTDILTNAKLDKIISIPPSNLALFPKAQALGPKTDAGLIDWYVKNFLPKAEGPHQYLYVDTEMKITVGTGLNLSDGRLQVYAYKDKAGKEHYSSSIPSAKKNKRVSAFDPNLFLKDEEYQNAILGKLTTIIRSFYIEGKEDIKNDRYTSKIHANRQQIRTALIYLSHRIVQEKEKKEKTGHRYHFPGAQSYVSGQNSIYADPQDTDRLERQFLKELLPALHQQVPRFSQFPAGAQLAILDMAYNTNFYRWKKQGSSVELHPFYEQINQETIDWESIATDPKNPASCSVADVTKNFAGKTVHCSNFFFWRQKVSLTRNIATQILLILADG